MAGGKDLLLLAAFLPLVRCQQNPTVVMLPNMTQVFMGDLLLLKCNDRTKPSFVKWTFDDKELNSRNETLRIAAAGLKDSGSYKCEINGEKSNDLSINVTEYAPTASLIIKTGHPVMQKYGSVILGLENDEGLKGWSCRVMREEKTKRIKLVMKDNPVSFDFPTSQLLVPETIYWCVDQTRRYRSNQVVIRTSDKRVSLEMYPMPAVAGESLTLKCLVWGTDKIFASNFYKDGLSVKKVRGSETYTIQSMTESEVGTYTCDANYRYVAQTVPAHTDISDPQDVPFFESPVRAELSEGMHCSCPQCDSSVSYRYYKKTGDSWTMLKDAPKDSGTYYCRGVMDNMRTLPSSSVTYNSFPSIIVVLIVVLLLLGLILLIVAYMMCKKRRISGAVYEDVGLRLKGGAKDPEYDTIQLGAAGSREKQGGEYESLKKEEMKESDYDTLGMEGASGGEGGYQELKKEKMKESEYDTLGMEGTSGGEGGYQELKKGQRTEEVYHTLKDQVEAEGDHYQCLKKEEIQKEEYETLQTKAIKPGKDIDVVKEIDENK